MRHIFKTLLTSLIIALLLPVSMLANFPSRDTIKIMTGDKQILIIKESKENQKQALKGGITDFKQKIQQTQKQIDSLQIVLNKLQAQLDTTSNSENRQKIENKIAEIKTNIALKKEFIDALKKGIEDINHELADMEKDSLKNNHEQKLKKFKQYKNKFVKKNFNSHWGGFEIGLNTLLLPNYKFINNTNSPLAPNLGSSLTFNFNFMEVNFKITKFWGLTSGFGLQFHHLTYSDFPVFDSNNYQLFLDSMLSQNNNIGQLKKVKLKYMNFIIPLLTEIQFDSKGNFYISAGGYVGIRTCQRIKYYYNINGKNSNIKIDLDNMFNPITYGLSAKLGLKDLEFFADYSLVPLFKNPNNPELYPIDFGIRCSF